MESRLREQAEELERVNRVKDEFLATLGHELRTPLNAIVGWSSLLLKGQLTGQAVQRAHEAIARNAESQRTLIEDVLDVSRIVGGRVRLETRLTDVTSAVNAAIESVRPYADERRITIRTAFRDGPATVMGDPSRLQQVFLNLLTNAVKFTGTGGLVRVSTDRVGAEVTVQVEDDGVGIPTHLLSHIFERFRQADSSATRKHTGLGLGLAIVRHLVELHGGTVVADSAGEGQGATFTVRLPFQSLEHTQRRAEDPHRGAASNRLWIDSLAATSTRARSLRGIRVMVVDDEPDARELASAVLEQVGASVEVAASGKEALARLKDVNPDVFLIDIAMPEMDGLALIREIRGSRSRVGRAPAIACTAYAREEDRRRALGSGFQLHLSKPVQPEALVEAVASVWERAAAGGSV